MAMSVKVPFITVGNRRCLTDKQLIEHPWLEAFFLRYKHCFERDPIRSMWLFIEREEA